MCALCLPNMQIAQVRYLPSLPYRKARGHLVIKVLLPPYLDFTDSLVK